MKNIVIALLVIALGVTATLAFTASDDNSEDLQQITASDDSTTSNAKAQGDVVLSTQYANAGLTSFPDQILQDTEITNLDLSGNNLTGALPSEIQIISKLEVLDVSDNAMTGIPAEIGQLSNLRVLNYANNQLTGLPNELGNLQKLEIFDLRGNNVSSQDLDTIKQQLPSTTQILL